MVRTRVDREVDCIVCVRDSCTSLVRRTDCIYILRLKVYKSLNLSCQFLRLHEQHNCKLHRILPNIWKLCFLIDHLDPVRLA